MFLILAENKQPVITGLEFFARVAALFHQLLVEPDQAAVGRERQYGVIRVFNEFGEEPSLFAGDRLGGAQFGQVPDNADRAARCSVTSRACIAAAAKMASRAIRERRDCNQDRPGQPLRKQFKCSGPSRSYYLCNAARFAFRALKERATAPADQVPNRNAFESSGSLVDAAQDAVVIEYEDSVVESVERRLPL